MTTRLVSLAAVSVLALGVVGCNQTEQPAAPVPPPATQPAPGTMAPTPADPASPQTPTREAAEHNAAALRAIATAQQSENGGRAYEIDDEGDDDTWEVDMIVGDRSVEVKVSKDGNTVIARDDYDDADNEDRARLDRAQINLTQAIEAALREVPGSLDDAELDDEDNRDVWKVTVDTPENDDIEVYVSPQDGSIIKTDR